MKQLDKTTKRNYFECMCDSEIFTVTAESDPQFEYIEMAMWSRGKGNSYAWKQKLRHVWQILRYGEPFADQIVFTKEEFARFKKFVGEI